MYHVTSASNPRLPNHRRFHNLLSVRIAFKEWAVVVDALGRGEQIIILRKGGISEGHGGFRVEHSEFFLFPTLYHQQRESVIPSAQIRFDQISPMLPATDRVRIEFVARVVDWQRLDSLEAAERLLGQHIWRDEVIAERLDWGKTKAIFALAVRVYRLPSPTELPLTSTYGGCKSWIELDQELSTEGALPVLVEKDFAEKLERFCVALAPAGVASG